IFHDTRQLEAFESHKEFGFGVGLGRDFSPDTRMEVLGFSFFSRLNQDHPTLGAETQFLRAVIPGYVSTKRDRHRIGFDTKIQWGPYGLWTQYVHGLDGEVKRQGIALQPTVSMDMPSIIKVPLKSVEAIYRFNFLQVRAQGLADNIAESPFTWDRQTHTFAMKFNSKYFFSWQGEYHLNLEKTGGATQKVKNDEFLSQITFFF
ncbi:MAG: hypothetical protein HYY61_03020, partial [Deltaproteobacteria bacterium]|nr:hypothetical protein [Deltaproteobacteria bacterium]